MSCAQSRTIKTQKDHSFLSKKIVGNTETNSVSFNFLLFNSRSLNNKVDNVMSSLISDKKVDIAAITETWLTDNSNSTTATIKSYGYLIHHDHRINQRGGGTGLIYKACCSLKPLVITKKYSSFEITCCKLKTQNSADLIIIIMYRTGSITKIFFDELDDVLSFICPQSDNIVVTGDLNIHFENIVDKNTKTCSDLLKSYGFKQQVFEPTHISGGFLDQIFTFSLDKSLSSSVNVDSASKIDSDHFPVYCSISLLLMKKTVKYLKYRNLKMVDKNEFANDYKAVLNDLDLKNGRFGDIYVELQHNTNVILNKHAPLINKKISIVKSAPWFDKEYRTLRSKRRKAEKTWRKSRNIDDRIIYKDLCDAATWLANVKKKQYVAQLINQSSNNAKTLFKVFNALVDRKQSNTLPDYTNDFKQLAIEFNTFFDQKIKKIRASISPEPEPEYNPFSGTHYLSKFIPTNENEIRNIIQESPIKTSPGDMLPKSLLEDNLELMIPTIVELVNLSLSQGSMESLKTADVIPSIKGESLDHNTLKNFRPVSNLQFIGKLVEKVVLRRLNDHMKLNNLNVPEQSAYKKDHSTETLLVRVTNDILIASDSKSATVVLLLDLSAAFDTVDHKLLLNILETEIGLKGIVLKWFRSFLTSRTQHTWINGTWSEDIVLMFGVPQGSVLGPVLFNIYIRSVYRYIHSLGFSIFGFADDHQIVKVFRPENQHYVLTEDVNFCLFKVQKWMTLYFLQLNTSKTQIIVFGPLDVLQRVQIHGTNLENGINIRFHTTVKNLGIKLDDSLSMRNQVLDTKKKSFRTLRTIKKKSGSY